MLTPPPKLRVLATTAQHSAVDFLVELQSSSVRLCSHARVAALFAPRSLADDPCPLRLSVRGAPNDANAVIRHSRIICVVEPMNAGSFRHSAVYP